MDRELGRRFRWPEDGFVVEGGGEMLVSRPSVHPVEAPPMTEAAENPTRVRMKDIQGTPGTVGGLMLRLLQFFFAVSALCVMSTTNDFTSVTSFRYDFCSSRLENYGHFLLSIIHLLFGWCWAVGLSLIELDQAYVELGN